VVSGTGNRLDEDIVRLAEAAADIYTDLIIKDSDPRDRPLGETAEIMRTAALSAGLPEERLRVILNEQEAIEAAFGLAVPGDLVVIQPDDIHGTIRMLLEHKEKTEGLDLIP
jgi:cyanophycin synthetase